MFPDSRRTAGDTKLSRSKPAPSAITAPAPRCCWGSRRSRLSWTRTTSPRCAAAGEVQARPTSARGRVGPAPGVGAQMKKARITTGPDTWSLRARRSRSPLGSKRCLRGGTGLSPSSVGSDRTSDSRVSGGPTRPQHHFNQIAVNSGTPSIPPNEKGGPKAAPPSERQRGASGRFRAVQIPGSSPNGPSAPGPGCACSRKRA